MKWLYRYLYSSKVKGATRSFGLWWGYRRVGCKKISKILYIEKTPIQNHLNVLAPVSKPLVL